MGEVATGASPHQAPLTPDGRLALAVVQGPGELAIIDTVGLAVTATVPVGKTPHWVTPSSDGRLAYVANEGSNDVSVVDLTSRRVVATIPVGQAPRKVAVQPGARAGAAGPDRIALEAGDYYFRPALIRATPGHRVILEARNVTSTLHTLQVSGQPAMTFRPTGSSRSR